MKQILHTLCAVVLFTFVIGVGTASAQNGQPHSLSATAYCNKVNLAWQAPASDVTLQWHDGNDYNGSDGVLNNPEGAVTIYVANKFTASDIAPYVGESIDAIAYYQYRPLIKGEVMIYENGEPVASTPADLSQFSKDTWNKVTLSKPYTLKAGTEVMFVVKMTYGRNYNLTAICDRAPQVGKGNLYSYDGKTWHADGPGDYLITAYVKNTATATPAGYNVYRNDTKVNADLITDTQCELTGEPTGTYVYKVSAVYDGDAEEKMSYGVTASPRAAAKVLPPVATGSIKSDGLSNTLTWQAPLKGGSELTWGNNTFAQAIGGTASTTAKVWVKQSFSAEDMTAFPNHQITAINAFVGPEGGITGVTLWVMKNGVFDYSEVVSDEVVNAIKNNDWNKFTLTTPYKMELGNAYAFGIYYTHTPKMHPVGVDNSVAVNNKGNEFSTSSPSSTNFLKSNPTWKTLASGKIAGNFMLSADVEALSDDANVALNVASYKVYRDGTLLADNLTETTYTDKVPDLGVYNYEIVAATADGITSPAYTLVSRTDLPDEYTAPIIIGKSQEGKNVKLEWSANAYEMTHCGKAANVQGFAESMSMLWGAKFTKEELKPYVGYNFYSIKFGIWDNVGTFKIEVRDNDNNVLLSRTYEEGDIDPGFLYNVTFDDAETFAIPADKDLYLCYNATLPAGKNVVLFDNGPAVDGGSMISLTNGVSWMKFGTLAPTTASYNAVISGMAVAPLAASQAGKAKVAQLSSESINTALVERHEPATIKLGPITVEDEGLGIASDRPMKAEADTEKPQVKSFRLYRNGEMVYEGTKTSYEATLDGYGEFEYYVTSVYTNGWESKASETATFSNLISQKGEAPYDLTATTDGSTLNLSWKAGAEAPELTYQHEGNDMVLGMTKTSGNLEGYHVIKFKAAEMADKVGQRISRIKFKLASTNLLSASVVVTFTDGVAYEQPIDLSSLVEGWNTVVLNTPVEIPAGQDVAFGYHITYESGVKPIVLDDQPAVAGYSDLISSTGSYGYWYSLATKFGQNYNYRISAFLEQSNVELQPQKAQRALIKYGYNVYRNGTKVNKSTITSTEYSIANAAYGEYTVTAVNLDGESSPSNKVVYSETTAITLPATATATDGKVYSLDGIKVSDNGSTANLPKGVYIHNGKKVVVK